MEVFLLSFEGLDSSDSGVLAIYSNRDAANEALEYAESLDRYYKVFIEKVFVSDKFFTSDFD